MKSRWIWGLFLAILLIAFYQPHDAATVNAQAGSTAEILRLVNQVRAGYGLSPLVWDGTLAAAAQNQTNYMATNNIYSHTGAGGSSPQTRALAAGYPGHATENIVGGTNLTPSQGVIWWQNSAIHFNTMISQRYIHAGVGFAQGHDQNFYTLVVGVPSDQAASPNLDVPVPGDETLAPVAPIQLAEPGEDGGITHVVGSGQSFWAIAARYEIPLEQLYLFNNLAEDSVINPGDTLIIRLADGQDPPPTPTPPASHIVRHGDSLWTIAAWHKLSLEELLWLNSMNEDTLVQEGDEVRIRLLPGEQPPPTATPQSSHIVRAGDTAWGISARYGLALEQLLGFNSLTENSVLSVGDKLLIVAPSPTPTETPEATATSLATATAFPVTVARITSTPLPQVVTLAKQSVATSTPVAPNNSTDPFGFGLETTIIVIGALLLGIGTVAILVLKK
jgi:uncharacterized protein YkwD